MAGIGFGTNYDVKPGTGLGGKTQIVALTVTAGGNLTQDQIDAFAAAVTVQGGAAGTAGLDAYTIAAVAGAAGNATVYFALQGTGTFATDTSNVYGVTGLTGTLTTTFTD